MQENPTIAGKSEKIAGKSENCRKIRKLINFFLYLDLDHIKLSLDPKYAICKDCNIMMTKKHLIYDHTCKENRKAEPELCQEPANQP